MMNKAIIKENEQLPKENYITAIHKQILANEKSKDLNLNDAKVEVIINDHVMFINVIVNPEIQSLFTLNEKL